MSRKQIKKILESQKKIKEEEEDEEDEEVEVPKSKSKSKPKANAFELLDLEDDMIQKDDDEEDEQAIASKPAKKKKKNKKKTPKSKSEDKKQIPKEEEDIDEILNSLDGPKGAEKVGEEKEEENKRKNVVEEERLFKLDARHLDPDQEIRRVFGAQVLGPPPARIQQPRNQKKNGVQKKTILVKAKEDWPPMYPGVDMQLLPPKPGAPPNVNYFSIVWSNGYQELQQHFYECVETADPYSFQDVLMIHPYHVDATLQLAQVCIQTGDYAMAGDMVERCLYAFECAWHPRFAPQGSTNCYLEFSVHENRSFFLAILKHIQLLGRRGSTRTALEFAKLLISLDPADPLYMRGVLDYYCMRGKEFSFLLTLFERAQVDNTPFSIYPNFCYSAALAKLTLELQKSNKSTTSTEATSSDSKRVGTNPYPLASSKYLLYNALTLFPMVLLPLLNKAGISYRDVLRGDSPSFFHADVPISPLLHKTVNLFVDKNNTLWKAPEVVTWLKEVMGEVQRQMDANGTEAAQILSVRDKVVAEWNEMNARMGTVPLLLSEHAETASPLPPELFVHNPAQPPHPAPNPVPLAANPLALFIQTLLPWVNVPPPPPPP